MYVGSVNWRREEDCLVSAEQLQRSGRANLGKGEFWFESNEWNLVTVWRYDCEERVKQETVEVKGKSYH